MFDKISGELYASGSFIVEETEGNCLYIVKRALVECNIDNESPIWKVKFIQSPHPPRLTCTCGLFEHMGMPCKHMLKVLDDLLFTAVLIIVVAQKNVCNSLLMGQVLVHQGATAIPAGNVQRRWTVCARNFSADDVTLGAGVNTEAIDAASRKNMLYLAAMDLMNYGSASTQGFNASMKAIAEAKFVLRLMTDANLEAQEPCTDISTQVGLGSDTFTYTDKCDRKILAPVKVKEPGRPATIRLKLRADYYGAKHRKT